uniref:C2H2-type domain-containing protein n=1 Tax=Apteryx owenii TaxID=8824 RepID=A0A8B9P4E3_APTOW
MTDLASPTGENPFAFPGGEESFGEEKVLVIHSQAEEEAEKEFKCILCGECFGQQPSLTRHQKHHAGERAFICAECGKGFSLKHNLIIHQRLRRRTAPAVSPAGERGAKKREQSLVPRVRRKPRTARKSRKIKIK